MEQYTSVAVESGLRWRLGRFSPWQPVTVSVAFILQGEGDEKELVLEHGVEIIEWANEQVASANSSNNNSLSFDDLVPSSERSEVLRYFRLADDFQNFDRTLFLEALQHDAPSVLRAVVGDGPPDLVLRMIGAVVGCIMRIKYQSTLQATDAEIAEKAKQLQEELVAKQKNVPPGSSSSLVYVVGSNLTMADIL